MADFLIPQDVYVSLEAAGGDAHSYKLNNKNMDENDELQPLRATRTTSDVGLPRNDRYPSVSPASHAARKKLVQASLICATFMIIEVLAGIYSNSLALLTDASHLLSDLSSFLISLFALWVSDFPGTRRLSFGYHRAEILGALMSVALIWILTAFLVIEAYFRLLNPTPVNGRAMFITAFCGTVANLVMTYILGVHRYTPTLRPYYKNSTFHGIGQTCSHGAGAGEHGAHKHSGSCTGHYHGTHGHTSVSHGAHNHNHHHHHHHHLHPDDHGADNTKHSSLSRDQTLEGASEPKSQKGVGSSCTSSPGSRPTHPNSSGLHAHSDSPGGSSAAGTTRAGTERPGFSATDDEESEPLQGQQLASPPQSNARALVPALSLGHTPSASESVVGYSSCYCLSAPILSGSLAIVVPTTLQKSAHLQTAPPVNVNLRAAYIHAVGDLIQNIGVLLAAGLIWYRPSLAIADPICTFFFSLLVLATTLSILAEATNVLMEGAPKEVDVRRLKNDLTSIPSVTEIHDLHVWSLSVGKPSLACHLVVDSEEKARHVLRTATQICQENYGVLHTTIQIDYSANKLSCETDAHFRCH